MAEQMNQGSEARQRAEQVARQVSGVSAVINNLQLQAAGSPAAPASAGTPGSVPESSC